MGLQLTLPKEKNQMYHTFEDAYWAVKQIRYTTEDLSARLICYPSRDASHQQGVKVTENMTFGGSYLPIVDSALYQWEFTAKIATVFPNGIPLSEDEQKTAIYEFVKAYTGLDFTDVMEE